MPDPFERVKKGDRLRIAAQAWNDTLDVVERAKRARTRAAPGSGIIDSDGGVVWVKNSGTNNVDRFGVLELSAPAILPSENLLAFQQDTPLTGITPTTNAASLGKFVIALQPIASNSTGLALATGVTPAVIDVQASSHGFADMTAGNVVKLTTGDRGAAHILYQESTSNGTCWAVVRLGNPPPRDEFWGEVTGNTRTSGTSVPQWRYSFKEKAERKNAGYGGWLDLSGGRTGNGTTSGAFNFAEDKNDVSSTPYGNGIASSNIASTGLSLQPIPTGRIVRMWSVSRGTNGTEYWFQEPNAVDGSCT